MHIAKELDNSIRFFQLHLLRTLKEIARINLESFFPRDSVRLTGFSQGAELLGHVRLISFRNLESFVSLVQIF